MACRLLAPSWGGRGCQSGAGSRLLPCSQCCYLLPQVEGANLTAACVWGLPLRTWGAPGRALGGAPGHLFPLRTWGAPTEHLGCPVYFLMELGMFLREPLGYSPCTLPLRTWGAPGQALGGSPTLPPQELGQSPGKLQTSYLGVSRALACSAARLSVALLTICVFLFMLPRRVTVLLSVSEFQSWSLHL